MGFRRFITLIICFTSPILPAGQQPVAHPEDICAGKNCSPDGHFVRFPFVPQGKQPGYRDYNSCYSLYCDKMNRTIMELSSSSVKVVVADIDFWSELMPVQSIENCFAKHLRDLDITPTPFRYSMSEYYTLFNCSVLMKNCIHCISLPCLDSHGYKVYAIGRNYPIDYLGKSLESCTKLYDIREEILFFPFIYLNWSLRVCQSCELRGGECRWKRTSYQIGCLGRKEDHSGNQQRSDLYPTATRTHSFISEGTWNRVKKLCITGTIIRCLLLILVIGAIYQAYFTRKQDRENQMRLENFLADYTAIKPARYSYANIKKMTNNFKEKLGEGGYGNVFKGKVANRVPVAVKLLHSSSGNGDEFMNEVGTMGSIHHVNVVRLLGFCADGYKRALVYEFLPNGSLDKFILQDGHEHHTLQMGRLQDIAIGIARGIEYLHQGCEQRILHFDIKPHNILLDENYNPKISDFGFAKLCDKGRSAVSMTAARGTMGYIAPEVFSRHFGNVSYKSDIYSFGMLLLEMVGRRKNIDATVKNISQVYFPEWVYGRLANGEELRIQVEEDGEDQMAKKLAIVGLWCIQWSPMDRPSISFVLQMLEGNGENLNLSPNPFTSGKSSNLANTSEHRPSGSALPVISES